MDVADLTRFNEAIDQALTESICGYTEKLDHSRNLFLGILGHDRRNPLGAIAMSAKLISRVGNFNDREQMLLTQINESTFRANEIVSHLLDLTRSRLGSGIPVIKEPMNMGFVAKQITDEMRAMHPDRGFTVLTTGNSTEIGIKRVWQKSCLTCLATLFSMVSSKPPIAVTADGRKKEVMLSVHNEGVPIPAKAVTKIFDSLTRMNVGDGSVHSMASANLGLGLFISKEIVNGHGSRAV